jgi:hypothetical protein
MSLGIGFSREGAGVILLWPVILIVMSFWEN